MPPPSPLGEFEVIVLLAVMHGGQDAHPPVIREEIERRTGRTVSRGSVYITLDRLEEKGLLTSRIAAASAPQRGGRPTRRFKVTAAGLSAVRRSIATLADMRRGLEPIVGDL
jgi:PadR family transcriptional regulator PadR